MLLTVSRPITRAGRLSSMRGSLLADPTSEMVKAALPNDLAALYPALQAQWDLEVVGR